MQPKPRNTFKQVFIWLCIVGALTLGFWQRQNIIDWWYLRGYEAPVPVAALATDTTMSDLGRRIFYIARPEIQDKAGFYANCNNGEDTIVLGCFKPPREIHILKVDDVRLAGVEQVTAAHEMLHAAYGRLSDSERERIGELLNKTYANANSPSITEKLKLYENGSADITNELHSILGTELAQLPPELETYYSRYFEKRSAVVAYSDQYQAVFTERKKRVAALDYQLSSIEKQVEANNAQLGTLEQSINAESARLDVLLQRGDIAEYNAGVAAYNQSLGPFRNLLGQTRALVEQYKTVLAERNQVALEAQELNKALDSKIDTTVSDI